ncbi:hypothetical protein GMDG_02854 [Pseudogymnoascus destructans 20631-21]|uniref:HTH CENPB-type domain-containing protein n=1 Tax=Pseudogymnoascus destructans (strain ATCC MYA-4855 / 20631-21) TaxID=658429 RepID=L8G7M1_PSED2|nr:hypothetical protein GMDG_02854 [Pseudogymnoascus destructans 20631-21]
MSSDMHSEAGTEANILDRLRKPVSNGSSANITTVLPSQQSLHLLALNTTKSTRLVEERGAITTTEILQKKAKEIWEQLPEYKDQPTPEFSYGWIM